MCIHRTEQEFLYNLQGIKHTLFQELETRALDMELTISNNHLRLNTSSELRKEKEFKKIEKRIESSSNESMAVTSNTFVLVKISTKPRQAMKALMISA